MTALAIAVGLVAVVAGSPAALLAQAAAPAESAPPTEAGAAAAAPGLSVAPTAATPPGSSSAPGDGAASAPGPGAPMAPAPVPPEAAPGAPQAPSDAPSLSEGLPIVVLRNVFAGGPRPADVRLGAGAQAIDAERVRTAGAARLRIVSPDPETGVTLLLRRQPGEMGKWTLTVVLISRERPHDFFYLAGGEAVVHGRREPQQHHRVGQGLETELRPEGGAVEEIVLQDEADAELRLSQTEGVLQLEVVPPRFGGHPTGPGRPWYQGEPLRFLDYKLLLGGAQDHDMLEAWIRDAVGVRATAVTLAHESLTLERVVYALQPVRGERWSLWAEAGFAAEQRTLSPAHGTSTSKSAVGYTAGLSLHVRLGSFGLMGHWADAAGTSVLQAAAGWQATRRLGLALSLLSYRAASPVGVALTWDW